MHSGSRRQAPSVVDGGRYRDTTDGNMKRVRDKAGVSPKWDICIACPAPKAQRSFPKRRCKDCKNPRQWETTVKQYFLDPTRLWLTWAQTAWTTCIRLAQDRASPISAQTEVPTKTQHLLRSYWSWWLLGKWVSVFFRNVTPDWQPML